MGMETPSGANRLSTILIACLSRLVGVGTKAQGLAATPLFRELGIAPIEATAAAARTTVFLKAPTLNMCIRDPVGNLVICAQILGLLGTCVGLIVLLYRASAELA
jgi:hypothetical protein